MTIIQFPERTVVMGKWTSPEILVLPANYNIIIYLGSSEWPTKAEIETIDWGLEGSTDNGKNWYLLVGTTSRIGFVTKTYMPGLSYTYIDLPEMMVRFYINPSVPIKLSASGNIT